MTLQEAWAVYESDKRLLGYSVHTLKAYQVQLRLIQRHLGNVEVDTITLAQLKEYLGAQRHLKPASLGHRIRFIRGYFRWLHEEGIVTKNAAARLREPKMGTRLPKALSEEDMETLREACVGAFEHSLVEFFYSTGCRIGEVAGLNRHNIDWESRSVIVLGKGDKEREVYFTIRCSLWLRRYLAAREDNESALFVTERKAHRMSIATLRFHLKRIAQQADVKTNIYPHKLRHSYATHLLNNGAPMEAIQSLLGHEKIDTTKIYAQLSGQRRKELYQKYF